MKIINSLPLIEITNVNKLEIAKKSILFTSHSAYEIVKKYINNARFSDVVFIDFSDKKRVINLSKEIRSSTKGHSVGYAIGSGRVIDIAKYLTFIADINLTAIPTMISTDAFLVDCTGVRENGCVTYIPSKKPDKVIIDYNLLKKTPLRYHFSGCGDVLSIYTGLFDWKYAFDKRITKKEEPYSPSVHLMAEGILNGLLKEKEEIKKGSISGISTIINCLAMEVVLCNLYGNSRPEEGGEHFFTYCIENKLPHFLHGEMVCFGILLTSFLQGQDWKKILNFLDEIGLNYVPDGLTVKTVLETLQEMPEYVKRHNLRFSIYNTLSIEKRRTEIESFLKNSIGVNK